MSTADTLFTYIAGRSRYGKTETAIAQFSHLVRAGHAGKSLQGGFLAYADLRGADLREVNFVLGSLAFGKAASANLNGASLGGTR